MPPKKEEKAPEKPVLGRFKNSLKMGVVGMPNVGKSTFFNLLCKQSVDAANYPFCTIDPSESQTVVPDERFEFLCEKHAPKSRVPAVLKVTDIAGLVKGAADGAGLGNAFLSHIAAVDGIFHMVRCFEDKDITHVETTVDPARDLEIIAAELRAKDVQTVERVLAGVSVAKRNQDKVLNARCEVHEKVLEHLRAGNDVRNGDWTPKEADELNELLLLSAKPVIVLVNLSEKDYIRRKNKHLAAIKKWVDAHGGDPILPLSCAFEQELADAPDDDARAAICKEKGTQSALPKIIKTGYDRLQLVSFFTAGPDEVRAWTIRRGSTAPQAAGAIHTDMRDGFIMAEVYSFDDAKEADGSEAAIKAAGKYKQQGKKYIVSDGDIMFFKFKAPVKKK